MKLDVSTIEIKDQINKYYRSYALYVIESRGIPNFYDSITPVQRMILTNSPEHFQKSVGVVGKVIETGLYHHGPASLEKSIAKLARPFACSEQVLLGDGFFGTHINPEPSAARYTSIKINPKIKDLLKKNSCLNELNTEGSFDWLNIEEPIGLYTHIVGIAVGYKSNILPRKSSDITSYLMGNKKQIKPYFRDFDGKVSVYNGNRPGWLIEGVVKIDEISREVAVKSLPPLMKYESFMKRLYSLNNETTPFKIENNSDSKVNVILKWKGDKKEFKRFVDLITKQTKMVVMEDIVFVKDGNVVVYENITDYLDEFRIHKENIILNKLQFEKKELEFEVDYYKVKHDFMKFMMTKKRKGDEIREWMKPYDIRIVNRLDGIKLTFLTEENLLLTHKQIGIEIILLKDKTKQVKEQDKICKILKKDFIGKGKIDMKKATALLDDDYEPSIIDGIEVFKVGEDDDEQYDEGEI
jgi:DNA gyrase/topoisomerase IV subunit A